MGGPIKARDLGAHVSHVAGLDRDTPASHDYDPGDPHPDPHATHRWVLFDRWAECEACGCRDHWPGAGEACAPIPKGRRTEPVTIESAVRALIADLAAFVLWARGKGLDQEQKPVPEWRAEVFEWARVGDGNGSKGREG